MVKIFYEVWLRIRTADGSRKVEKKSCSHIQLVAAEQERERGRWGKGEKWQEKVFVIQAKQENTRGRADGEDLQP